MFGSFPQSGLTTTMLDFTNDLSLLLIGLVGLLWLSASAIVWMAVRHARSQKDEITAEASPSGTSHRDAA
jgi:hypothetical protein